MDALVWISPWVLGSVGVGLIVGFFLGRGRSHCPERDTIERERRAALSVLVELLDAVEQLNSDVKCRNTEIEENAEHVGRLKATGEMETVKKALLGHMTALLQTNKQLQQDVVCTRYRLEEQAQQIDDARHEARTDVLTTVANRKALDEKLHLLLDAWRRKREFFVLMLLDLDQFKWINDAHGHLAGDHVLAEVGRCLKEGLREGDFVGRFGGDEFVVLLPRTSMAIGLDRAETLRSRVADQVSRVALRDEAVAVSLSIGVAESIEDDTPESIMHRADQAMYRAKRQGRNQVQCRPLEPEEVAV